MKIVQIVDTRQYDEGPDGKFFPIPGSGDARECDRCGRLHEVHAHVERPDGSLMIVGTGCMGLGPETSRKCAGRASTVARLEAELRRASARLAERTRVEAEVAAMTPPEPVYSVNEHDVAQVTVGDGLAWMPYAKTPADRQERLQCATNGWRTRRIEERTAERSPALSIAYEVADLERRLVRARTSLAQQQATAQA